MDTLKQNINSTVHAKAWLNGFIGVLIFSGSVPATKVAMLDFEPIFVTVARATIAGLIALLVLFVYKVKKPNAQQLKSLLLVTFGVVLGFPLLSALALQYVSSAHSIVYVGLLPLSTAIFSVLLGGERPKLLFWFFSIIGSLLVVGYAVYQGFNSSPMGEILMFGAVILCGLGYAQGGNLSKELGGWQVISWALVISLPICLILSILHFPSSLGTISISAWIGLAYVSVFSMFIGFIFWYKGLAQGGVASVGQLQLLQPFFALAVASLLLHEKVSIGMLLISLCVILSVIGSKKYSK